MKPLDSLAIAQVDRRLKALGKALPYTAVRPGWIHYMRRALNMTLKQLAERAGLSVSSVAQAERNEAASHATLATLRKMAQAMDCELIYAFVPKTDINKLMKQAAHNKAKRILASADIHMSLEDQGVERSFEERLERLANKLLEKGDIW